MPRGPNLPLPLFCEMPVSLPLILATLVLCEACYQLLLKNVVPGLFRSFLLDFVSCGESVVLSWELITVFSVYSQPLWACLTYAYMVLRLYRSRSWKIKDDKRLQFIEKQYQK